MVEYGSKFFHSRTLRVEHGGIWQQIFSFQNSAGRAWWNMAANSFIPELCGSSMVEYGSKFFHSRTLRVEHGGIWQQILSFQNSAGRAWWNMAANLFIPELCGSGMVEYGSKFFHSRTLRV